MRKRLKDDNAGYSLVEMIIVLAIVAVVSAMAIVSITMIHSAKAKEAAVTFDSEVSTLITKSKNMNCDVNPNYSFCLKIYKDGDGKYYIQKGYYYDPTPGATTTYIFDSTTDPLNDGKGTCLSSYVSVKYIQTGSATEEDVSTIYIRYDRKGMCIEGDGTYRFYKRNGTMVASVYLRKNGSHETR